MTTEFEFKPRELFTAGCVVDGVTYDGLTEDEARLVIEQLKHQSSSLPVSESLPPSPVEPVFTEDEWKD